MRFRCVISLLIAWLMCAPAPVRAAGDAIENVLPAPACAEGWNLDGKATLFNRETLFDRINGEAELYFPYGFDVLASARYANIRDPRIAVDADVYRMGSLLDAFGMYANYRRKENVDAKVGAEGTLSPSQLIFYQGRYFVRIQATGTSSLEGDVFLACARAISQKLPPNTGRPKELEGFAIPAVVPRSERYIAQSLLGYDFFRRGLMADAVLNGEQVQLLLVPEDSGDAASRAFDRYRSYLKSSGADVQAAGIPGRMSLSAVDPLYGNVFVVQAGRFIVGAVRFKDPSAAKQLVDQLRRGVSGE
ncbi:MAG: hypothetical protein Q7U75_15400 [Desulfobacterales bacterium]|nr:hypothetical protein [Desulfobacterales bacterium]